MMTESLRQPISSECSIDHYVILLSEHNVAEFKAIVQFQIKNVHLINTKKTALENFSQRFENAINAKKMS